MKTWIKKSRWDEGMNVWWGYIWSLGEPRWAPTFFLLYLILCQIKDPIMESLRSSLKSLILLLWDFLWPWFKRAPLSASVCVRVAWIPFFCLPSFPDGFLNFYCNFYLHRKEGRRLPKNNCFSLVVMRFWDEQNIIALNCFCIVSTLSHFSIFCNVSPNRSNTQQSC